MGARTRRFETLQLDRPRTRLGDLWIRQLALHQHVPASEGVARHSHRFCQWIVYFSGGGVLEAGSQTFTVRAGTVAYVPAACPHAFVRAGRRGPVCLVIDAVWGGGATVPMAVPLGQSTLNEVQTDLKELRRALAGSGTVTVGAGARAGLVMARLIGRLLDACGWAAGRAPRASAMGLKIHRLLEQCEGRLGAGEVAERLGMSRDALSRRLRQETGVSVQRWCDVWWVERARERLRGEAESVGAVGASLGFEDANYFARWFRRQTGQSPMEWRASGRFG